MTDKLTLCNMCNCMTKTITTANTPVCGKCKEIKTSPEVRKYMEGLR